METPAYTHLQNGQCQQHRGRRQDVVRIRSDQIGKPQYTTFLQLRHGQRCHSPNRKEKGHEQRHLDHGQQHGPKRRTIVLLPQLSKFLRVDHLRALVPALGSVLNLGHDHLLLRRNNLHSRIVPVHPSDEWEKCETHDTGRQGDRAPPW